MLIAVLAFSFAACSQQSTWQEQYDLGVRYLSEGNYEEAIIAFTAAIEIEPKLADAYIGLADTYLAMGEEDLAYDAIIDGINACGEQHIFDNFMSDNFDGLINIEMTKQLRNGILTNDDIPNIDDYTGGFKNIVIGDTMDTVLEKLGFDTGYSFPSVKIYVEDNPQKSIFKYYNEPQIIIDEQTIVGINILFFDEERNDIFHIDYCFEDDIHLTTIFYYRNPYVLLLEETNEGDNTVIIKTEH